MFKAALEGQPAVWAAKDDREMVAALDRRDSDAGYQDVWHRAANVLAARGARRAIRDPAAVIGSATSAGSSASAA
jgi:hypothetical protein